MLQAREAVTPILSQGTRRSSVLVSVAIHIHAARVFHAPAAISSSVLSLGTGTVTKRETREAVRATCAISGPPGHHAKTAPPDARHQCTKRAIVPKQSPHGRSLTKGDVEEVVGDLGGLAVAPRDTVVDTWGFSTNDA